MGKKRKNKFNENENVKAGRRRLCITETRSFDKEMCENIRRKSMNLPKIRKNGTVTYEDDDNDGDTPKGTEGKIEKRSKKIEKSQKVLRKMLDKINKKKGNTLKNSVDENITKILNKINHMSDLKSDIATIANSIIGDQNNNMEKFDLLFYIFDETLKRKKHLQESINSHRKGDDKDSSKDEIRRKYMYLKNINILVVISLCTVLKCITPSYKIIANDDYKYEENEVKSNNTTYNSQNKMANKSTRRPAKRAAKGSTHISVKTFSKVIENVNTFENTIVNYFKRFCKILKCNIADNVIVYVNLLCEIVSVNLYLSRSEQLFKYIILYANMYTYFRGKHNNWLQDKNKPRTKKNNPSFGLLCMKCLNTLKEIMDNDSNLSFTLELTNYFVNYLFKRDEKISPDLLRIFSKIKITEKKINAKLYGNDDVAVTRGENDKTSDELRIKTSISGELKIIEKNTENILDQLFFLYLCVLREYNKYSILFVKNVLYGISHYALYINKILMDDVFYEIKELAMKNVSNNTEKNEEKDISPSLILTTINVFLEILNKVNDDIYIDCSWIALSILKLLDSSIPHFHIGSTYFLFEQKNFVYNSFADGAKARRHFAAVMSRGDNADDETVLGKNVGGENWPKRTLSRETLSGKGFPGKGLPGEASPSETLRNEKCNFSSELLYCIGLLLKTRNFSNSYNNFISSNNQLLSQIVHKLINISLHADYAISFAILKLVQSIFVKYPLIKPIVEEEGIVTSLMSDNLSVFFQNALLHSCIFKDISALALDISLNDSNDTYQETLKTYINQNKCDVKNKIIHYNINLREDKITDEDEIMNYDMDDAFHINVPSPMTKIFRSAVKTYPTHKSQLTFAHTNESISLNYLPPYMLTAIDFVEVLFSPYEEFIRYFQIKRENKNHTNDDDK
ncbi:conserved Plasmodium protein, unknown function [Plasmodium ovale]|nr:conserved Plasmodium protein, unknown function [Plasmodium ovale]